MTLLIYLLLCLFNEVVKPEMPVECTFTQQNLMLFNNIAQLKIDGVVYAEPTSNDYMKLLK